MYLLKMYTTITCNYKKKKKTLHLMSEECNSQTSARVYSKKRLIDIASFTVNRDNPEALSGSLNCSINITRFGDGAAMRSRPSQRRSHSRLPVKVLLSLDGDEPPPHHPIEHCCVECCEPPLFIRINIESHILKIIISFYHLTATFILFKNAETFTIIIVTNKFILHSHDIFFSHFFLHNL